MRNLLPMLEDVPWPTLIAGPLLLVLFVILIIRVVQRGRNHGFDYQKNMPLDDERQDEIDEQTR